MGSVEPGGAGAEQRPHILHELYVFSEWKPDPDFVQKSDNILPGSLNAFIKWITFVGPKKSMLDNVSLYKEQHQRWQISLGDEGKVIAVVTDNILEIRTKRSDYSTIAARTTVVRDPYPQWRKVVWSPDCSFLVLAHSNGNVCFYDLTASNVFNIPADCSRPGGMECTDTTHALSAVLFTPMRVKDNKWTWEVLLVTYDGKLRGYTVSQTDGVKLQHTFQFAGGVSSATYNRSHNLLFVGGLPRVMGKDSASAMDCGISAWRILNDDPFYKLSVASEHIDALVNTDHIHYYMPFFSSRKTSFVVSMVTSPDASKLVCVHTNGEISIWRLPLLKLLYRWGLREQPEHDLNSPLVPIDEKYVIKVGDTAPADVNWWSNEEIIISRFNGSVTICGIEDMVNILGKKPEFLQGAPQVTGAYDNTFLALECESKVISANQLRNIESEEPLVVDNDVQGTSLVESTKELIKTLLYAITDIEHFQPKPKKITVVSRIYRLLGIKSTTPMDLFLRKIEGGNYDEALNLAATFNLDSDLVYQQQWRTTPVSCDAICNYLGKVSKIIWVVHQCVDRLPETMSAARDLLNFGLELTNAEILEEVNRGKDKAIKDPDEILLEDLNAHTSELLRCRHVMLFYAERLKLYESILECEKSTYLRDEYHRLRSNSIVHSSIELAKEGRIEALACLWLQISSVAMQLTVLENIPETINPQDYANMLPTLQNLTEKQISERVPVQNRDWCRKDIFRSIWNSTWSEDTSPENEINSVEVLTSNDIAAWYEKRARQMEERSGMGTHALTLVIFGVQHGVPKLERILFYLVTLDVFMYELNLEGYTLNKLEKMTPLETCKALISRSTPETFVEDLKLYVVPYLKRHELLSSSNEICVYALCSFLEHLSVDDLSHILLVLKSPVEFEIDLRTHIELMEKCLLSHNTTEQLDMACDLLTTIIKDSDYTISPSDVLRRKNVLENLLNACKSLSSHGVNITLAELKNMREDVKKIQMLLTKMARNMSTRNETPQQQDWEMLLSDILELQESFFTSVDKETCFQIYGSSLLTSGSLSSIKLASQVLACDNKQTNRRTSGHLVSYQQAVDLILVAAKEYFNSASSLKDPSLELARACLNLINDDNEQIKEELDLISALSILHDFGLTILPIQVRLCEDRMSLIEDCLNMDSHAYQASHKLLALAKLLRVAGDDEQKREGLVLHRVAESAVRAGSSGASAAAEAARRLAALRHAPAAALLAHVATQAHTDRPLRRVLLDAAATHCAQESIEDIIRARLNLEMEEVQQAVGERLSSLMDRGTLSSQETFDSADDDYADAVQTPVIENKGLFTPTLEENVSKISNMLLDNIWTNKFNLAWTESSTSPVQEKEIKADKYAVHSAEFYHTLYPEQVVSDASYRYDRFALPDAMVNNEIMMGQAFLEWFYINERLEPKTPETLECQVMLKCAMDCMYEDTALCVAHLLRALSYQLNPKQLAQLQQTENAVSIALYALLIQYNEYAMKDEVFLTRPVHLARITLGESNPPLPRQSITDEQIAMIMMCINKLMAMLECNKLNGYGCPVDTLLFNDDHDYKEQSIYRLARSPNNEHIEYACSLAVKYDISTVKVWVQHLSAIIQRSGGSPVSEVNTRLANQEMLQVLHKNKEEAVTCIKQEIWEHIPGEDHTALIYYYTLVKNIDDKTPIACLVPSEHVKLLKKVKAASPELNYKVLLKQPSTEEFTEHLMQILRPENIGLVTKLLRTFPSCFKLPVSVNTIYTIWLTEHFFSVGSVATSKKWMQQYRQCASYFNKLSKEDLLCFIKNTCFTKKAIERVPAGTRNLMILQAADYCQQEQENDLKFNSKSELSWSEVGKELMRWARFLDNYASAAVQSIIDKDSPDHRTVWTELESSRGEVSEAQSPLAKLVVECGLKPQSLLTLLQCLHLEISIDDLFRYIVDHHVLNLRCMQKLVTCLVSYDKANVKLSEEALEHVMKRATALGLQPHLQISLLSLSQKKRLSDEGDVSKMAQFSLQLLQTEWGEAEYVNKLTETDLQSDAGRRAVFRNIVSEADNWQKKKTIVDVMTCWPDFSQSCDERSPFCEFIHTLLSDGENQKENGVLLKLLLRRPVLSDTEAKWLAENAHPHATENVLWMILLTKSETLKDFIPQLLKQEHRHQNVDFNDELLRELLDNGLFTKLVSTSAYTPLLNYIRNVEADASDSENEYSIEWAVKELTKAKFLAEAGHLVLIKLGVPSSLRGFSQTVLCQNYKD